MIPYHRRLRACVATGTMVVVAALSVAVPLLDQGSDPAGVVFTDAGAPGYVDHHHDVCLQHSASAWSQSASAEPPTERFVRDDETRVPGARHTGPAVRLLPLSRAPPLI